MSTPGIRNMMIYDGMGITQVSMTFEIDGECSNDPKSSSETKMIRAYEKVSRITQTSFDIYFAGSIATAAYPVVVGVLVGLDSNKKSLIR